ncbi:NACHT domain- and WD repeat-containing protein 1 [Rhinopithecus roxellana]|uniref:NACHT domain- and WD repeat-containing protein 1 n=1 Tax=Rhinopithecus roxellana TaxID=61622 RepID=UPI0012370CD9|nr:NACHT domain- and WD repeat-containing protein 1 [Rhinopithecus roxellana]
MVDRLADGCLDTDAQNLLSSLKGRITDTHPGVLKAHRLPWSRDLVNPKNKIHARYLKELGEQFVARANHQVLERLCELDVAGRELAWLYQEIRHHLWQSSEVTQNFCGRQELLARLGQQLRHDDSKQHTPLVLFGPPGIGKTALMCKLAEQMPRLLGHKTVTVLRLLGTSQMSSDARGLLKSVCFQVCLAYGLPLPPAQVLDAHTRVVQFFHTLLHTVSCRNFESLVLLLDAMDDLDSVRHARRVPWLPLNCPPRVHLILSACSGALGVLDTLQRVLLDPEAYWEVKPLSGNQRQEMIQHLLVAARRTLSPVHTDLFWASLPECGNPGQLRLAFEEARKWASFTVPAPLATTAEEATHQLCTRLEQTHGQLLVAHVLGYIVSSRHGLSEAELKDVLSLDDEVLQAVYRDWTPPSKELLRFPPLLWVRLRRDLGYYLARRPVDGFTLLAIAHRQLVEVVRERYLSGSERAKRHTVLADFFSGTWSQGTKKLITLPLVGKPLNLDRKVAPQPLWFSDTVANLRKLKELPYHLLHSGRLEELKQEVLGSMSWISCRGISGGIEDLLDDFDLCAPHLDSPEVGLVREALQLCRPAVELRGMERSLLYTELLARLHFFATSHPALVGQLCQQAQSWFRLCTHPVLVPLGGFLQPPGGPLRATLSGCHKAFGQVRAIPWSFQGYYSCRVWRWRFRVARWRGPYGDRGRAVSVPVSVLTSDYPGGPTLGRAVDGLCFALLYVPATLCPSLAGRAGDGPVLPRARPGLSRDGHCSGPGGLFTLVPSHLAGMAGRSGPPRLRGRPSHRWLSAACSALGRSFPLRAWPWDRVDPVPVRARAGPPACWSCWPVLLVSAGRRASLSCRPRAAGAVAICFARARRCCSCALSFQRLSSSVLCMR